MQNRLSSSIIEKKKIDFFFKQLTNFNLDTTSRMSVEFLTNRAENKIEILIKTILLSFALLVAF